ncbi:asparaginase [Streptomyces beihaiensis]|uniref:asparaginase n=1 Tax=Streptomyces beihaiensis TaxID=2984495 RepID=A0ABT3TV20_9ACTN|nr:asparaginase [Streptomyces beihaiensis]MCX3060889.1 asparaginase [Streptomyces beihaiensis]
MERIRPDKPRRITLISTGGTIASRWQGTGYAADAAGDTVLASAAVPAGVEVRVLDLFNVNSSRMTSDLQLALVRTVRDVLADPDVDGIVVTHGTDTLEESAFLVDLHHDDPRPVVFTGAQLPLGAADGDGPGNMHDAIQAAATVRGLGVLVVFNGTVHAARGTVKTQTLAPNAFDDPSAVEPLGRLGFGRADVRRAPRRPAPLPVPGADAAVPRVDIVMHHSDADPALFEAAVAAGARGIVLVATGAGNATPAFVEAVRAAAARGILVVVTTRVPAGPLAEIYTGGGAVDLVAAGAVLSGTLRAGQARIAVLSALLASADATRAERTQLLRRLIDAPAEDAAHGPAADVADAPADSPAHTPAETDEKTAA